MHFSPYVDCQDVCLSNLYCIIIINIFGHDCRTTLRRSVIQYCIDTCKDLTNVHLFTNQSPPDQSQRFIGKFLDCKLGSYAATFLFILNFLTRRSDLQIYSIEIQFYAWGWYGINTSMLYSGKFVCMYDIIKWGTTHTIEQLLLF